MEEEGISACLIIKDDNSRLIEWIAYHYQVLPMRTLVVAVDHTSKTSPNEILARWNNTYMEVYSWNFTDFIPRLYLSVNTTMQQRTRQGLFHEACFKFLKKKHKKWVTAIDTDEYMAFNRFSETDPHWNVRNATLAKAAGGTVSLTRQEQLILARTRIPDLDSPTTVLDFIRQEEGNPPWDYQACIPTTRLMFGARENPSITQQIQSTLTGIVPLNASKLDTLRFFQHRSKGVCKRNCKGKVLLDVTRIPEASMTHPYTRANINATTPAAHIVTGVLNPHAPVPECNNTLIPSWLHSVLRVHHYLGSEEAFFARKDYRGVNRDKKFNWYKNLKSLPEMEAAHWLSHFVRAVGPDQAVALLQGAGEVEYWKQQKLAAMAASSL